MTTNTKFVVGGLSALVAVVIATVFAATVMGTGFSGPSHDDRVTTSTATNSTLERNQAANRVRTPQTPIVFLADVQSGRLSRLPRSIRSMPATNFQSSPDGTRLAFNAAGKIYLAKVDGTQIHAVAKAGTESAPSWSRDSRSLVYNVAGSLRVLDLRTGEIVRLLDDGHDIYHPNFSADGERVLFTRRYRGNLSLWTTLVDGGPATPLKTPPWRAVFGTYSPDGASITFRRTGYDGEEPLKMTTDALYIADEDGSNTHRLTKAHMSMSQIDSGAMWPAWSPDGRRIAYQPLYNRGVYVLDVRTGKALRICSGVEPVWLDNDTLIVEAYSEYVLDERL